MSHHVVERDSQKVETKDLQQSANARWHTREKDFQPSRLFKPAETMKRRDQGGHGASKDFLTNLSFLEGEDYFTSQVSPARSSLFRSPRPRLAITSLTCWFITSS